MRDKQAFEAYVLEKSRAQQQKMQIRRKRILATGMSLCVCVIALVGFSVLQGEGGNHVESLPDPTLPAQNGATHGSGASQNTPQPTVLVPTETPVTAPGETPDEMPVSTPQASLLSSIPKYTAPSVAPPGTNSKPLPLPLDEAFAQKKSEYAIPDVIEVFVGEKSNRILEVTRICQICDWMLEGVFAEGQESKGVDCTIKIYYGQDSITCYVAEGGFFKMKEGTWLETDPAYVAMLIDILEGN